ncbi:RNA polymerase sigma factor SigY [Fredinandcohnia quinoae]|uniref:RNA polymerase sigma factor n=1 Tax=Fredinandcohnia quinoae TaxID=2918902 RepID=A0AAW5EAK8_9BACI|nr:RNA polymerase sigma factor SigY [Fredinandcohnia sp. SECRCQ15]MCH1627066.1 RNA polymerase sigma factor SigY [Fredinandcohnia sp. SECRCQ15]
MDDKDLIKSAKRGDSLAFAMLFKEHYPFLVKYLIKITMNPDIAEDLAQETMMKSIEKIKLYNGKSKFSSWLITIATNLYIDNLRRKKREQNYQLQEQALRKMKWQFESRTEEWNDVMVALGMLSNEIRIPIVLKHYYGYSYEEIADMLQIALGTVKSRIHNGIQSVRKELKSDEEKQANSTKKQTRT